MLEAVGTFRRWYQSRAPLVVMENSKMHPYARRVLSLTPNEIVRPFEHGHPETKAICLFKLGRPTEASGHESNTRQRTQIGQLRPRPGQRSLKRKVIRWSDGRDGLAVDELSTQSRYAKEAKR